jgi:hypothetical protein
MIFETVRRAAQIILPACFAVGLLSAQSITITSSPTLPPASVSVSYPLVTLTATGGSPPYSWTVVGVGLNGLPTGMTLTQSGVLQGPADGDGPVFTHDSCNG